MTRFRWVMLLVAICAGPASSASAVKTSFLEELVGQSDAIVVADITEGSTSGEAHVLQLRVAELIKGSLTSGAQLQVLYVPTRRKGSSTQLAKPSSGLVFLKALPSGWMLQSSNNHGIGVNEAFWPLSSNLLSRKNRQLVGSSPLSQVVGLLADSIEGGGESGAAAHLVTVAPPLIAKPIYNSWLASSRNPALRLVAYRGLIASGDKTALLQSLQEVPPASADAGVLSGSFAMVDPSDTAAVSAIGQYAASQNAAPVLVGNAAGFLLRAHSRESLPYLYRLLDSADMYVRSCAVSGFSAFALNVRTTISAADASEVLDEVLNPARRSALPQPEAPFDTDDIRMHVHFGMFPDQVAADKYSAYWKTWYDVNRIVLGPK